MTRIKKALAVLLSGIIIVSFAACSQKIKDYSKDLTVYTIDAVLDDETKTLNVTQTVDYANPYDVELNELYFHLYPSAYREGARFSPFTANEHADAYPNGVSYGSIKINSLKVEGKDASIVIAGQDEDILVVAFNDYLMPESRIKIEMTYTVTIPNVRHRLGYYNKTINLGNFYPVACVYEYGEFESSPYYSNGDPFYSHAANYNVSITAPKKYTAAMSGKTEVESSGLNDKTTASSIGMRDYAIVLGEFSVIEEKVDNTVIKYYYYDDAEFENSLKVSKDSLKTFNDMFCKYPYETLSVVQTHFLAGGMEYPGLVYISDVQTGEIYRDVIVHEIAHQWWYGIVGNNQIAYAWLDETTAEYAATLFYEANPSYNVGYSARITDALSAYGLYCELFKTELDTTMARKLPDFRTSREYTIMTYVKGQVMMDTLRKTIGDDAMKKAFKNYFSDNYLSIAKPDNFIAAFEKTSGKDLGTFFSTWLDGNVVTFSRS